MKLFLKRNQLFLALVLIFICAELIVNPLGNFPLNDDWSYGRTLHTFYRCYEVFLGNWPAMTLCTQILWGFGLTKIFGLSFFVLRCSTMLSAIIGYAFLNKLITQLSGNKRVAFLACLVLVFNPLIFNLTNTFMTDVNFNTLFIICTYFMYNFFRTNSLKYYAGFVLFSIAAILLRQYGIIFPLCFIAAGFFMKEKKVRAIILGTLALVCVAATLKLYEDYLKILMPAGAMYKFSGGIAVNATFIKQLFGSFMARHKEMLIYTLMYTMPFAVVFLGSLLRQVNLWLILVIVVIDLVIVYYLLGHTVLTSPTVFANMTLGDETFYLLPGKNKHNHYAWFDTFMFVIRCVSCFMTLLVLLLIPAAAHKKNLYKRLAAPAPVLFIMLALAYTGMLLITESYFDRYHIPLITLAIVVLSYAAKTHAASFRLAVIPLAFWAIISIAGTKDYLAWNRLRWEAYWYLRKEMHAPATAINGGFEVRCWNEGCGWGYRDFSDIDNYRYLIGFNGVSAFKPLKAYEFQRYFPYKKDKIYIFVKEDVK